MPFTRAVSFINLAIDYQTTCMKKLYFLPLFCFLGIAAHAQTTTTTIYATNTSTYQTGHVTATARTTGNIVCTGSTERGWSVFSLSTIPAGTIINSCLIGFRLTTYGGSGTPSGWSTYGYAGDLSTVTTAATLFSDCTSGSLLSTATYGTAAGNRTLATTAASQSFMTANVGSNVSLCWTGGNARIYTITGYAGGASTTAAGHRPYITLKYCTGVTGVAATATPDPVCSGSTLTLTGSGTGTTTYLWNGPGGFTSTLESPTLTASATSVGVYTFTAYNTGGCATTVTTASVTLASPPAPITGATSVCTGSSTPLSETVTGGTWASGPSTVATVSTSGVVAGIGSGTAVITNTNACGVANYTVTVNASPAPITGPDTVCQGGTVGLVDPSTPGTWSSSSPTIASVSSSGVVSGLLPGNTTITFMNTASTCTVTANEYVSPAPAAISGLYTECQGQSITLTESVPGGTWSSSNSSLASVSSMGVVTGIVGGSSIINITYSNACGSKSIANVVETLPSPIVGIDSVCALSSSVLSSTTHGGTWTSSNDLVATVSSLSDNSANATGVAQGSATITYTLADGCYTTGPYTVASLPLPIVGPSIGCPSETISLTDPSGGDGVWSSDDTFVAVIGPNTGILTGVSPADTVTIYYTMPEGCYVSTLIYISTLPAPISGITATCAGLTDTLKDDTLGGTWSTANISIATINANGVLTTISQGTTAVTYTIPATGCYVTASELVHPLPVPVITFDGADNTFSVGSGYSSYQWYSGPDLADTTAIPGAISYNLAALYNQYYTVIVTDSFGCMSAAAPYDMTDLSVNNLNAGNTFSINPNPATSVLSIHSSVAVNAIISDMDGKVIMDQKNATQIDISKLANGIYMISLYDLNGNKVTVQKFIKE